MSYLVSSFLASVLVLTSQVFASDKAKQFDPCAPVFGFPVSEPQSLVKLPATFVKSLGNANDQHIAVAEVFGQALYQYAQGNFSASIQLFESNFRANLPSTGVDMRASMALVFSSADLASTSLSLRNFGHQLVPAIFARFNEHFKEHADKKGIGFDRQSNRLTIPLVGFLPAAEPATLLESLSGGDRGVTSLPAGANALDESIPEHRAALRWLSEMYLENYWSWLAHNAGASAMDSMMTPFSIGFRKWVQDENVVGVDKIVAAYVRAKKIKQEVYAAEILPEFYAAADFAFLMLYAERQWIRGGTLPSDFTPFHILDSYESSLRGLNEKHGIEYLGWKLAHLYVVNYNLADHEEIYDRGKFPELD